MHKKSEYLTIAGLFLLVAVAIVLVSTPEDIFSSIVVIDLSKTAKTPYEMLVTTVYDFKNSEELGLLPKEIGTMKSRELNITSGEAKMGALMKRMYSDENASILFMLLSSQKMTEFHNLEICYSGSWNITEKDVMEIQSEKLGEAGYNNIHVNKFLIQRGNLEEIVLHWYQWDGGLVRTDKNFLLIQIGTPVENTAENATVVAEEFTKEFFLKMYKPLKKTKPVYQQIIDSYGIAGILINVILILIPITMVFNAQLTRKK